MSAHQKGSSCLCICWRQPFWTFSVVVLNMKPTNLSFHLSPRETFYQITNLFYTGVQKPHYSPNHLYIHFLINPANHVYKDSTNHHRPLPSQSSSQALFYNSSTHALINLLKQLSKRPLSHPSNHPPNNSPNHCPFALLSTLSIIFSPNLHITVPVTLP